MQQALSAAAFLAVAVALGGAMGARWLAAAASTWAADRRARLWRWAIAGALLALLANLGLLWMEAAAMAEVPLAEAGASVTLVLSATHYGIAWSLGAAALVLTALAAARRWDRACIAAVALFCYTRSMMSHAAAAGDFNAAMLADWTHLLLVSAWIGAVLLAALVTLAPPAPADAGEQQEQIAFTRALSGMATFALAGLAATGLYSAWHRVGAPAHLLDTAYGIILLAKLVPVALAALLGGVNRFVVMPAWFAADAHNPHWARRFRRILLAESVLLVAALALAAQLATTAPPLI